MKLDSGAYASQMLQLGEHFYDPTSVLVSAEFKATEEAKERLAQEVEKQNAKRYEGFSWCGKRLIVDEKKVIVFTGFFHAIILNDVCFL